MRRITMIIVTVLAAVFATISGMSAYRLFTAELALPAATEDRPDRYRLVLISQDLDRPFWTDVERGARTAAHAGGIRLEAWGTFGLNEQDFLNLIEIAIASKVDGIIVQGLDTDGFKHLTSVKATAGGIPVITVANDVPPSESLRRTYVGSDHYEAGRMIARQLLFDMGFAGEVILMVSDRDEDFQRSRLEGILDVLRPYPDIVTDVVAAGPSRESAAAAAGRMLNEHPGTRAFIAVAADHTSAVVREIGRRSRVEDYYIYTFDDGPDTQELLEQGAVDAIIAQSPEAMGEESVRRMIEWLEGRNLPLSLDGYYTDIRVLKPGDPEAGDRA